MERRLATGKYNAGLRPSHHHIGADSFKANDKGAIPPNVLNGDDANPLRAALNDKFDGSREPEMLTNLLKGTNTRSFDRYQDYWRACEVSLHPARMPADLVEFFVRLFTDKGDLVLDPFGGSNTTGASPKVLGASGSP